MSSNETKTVDQLGRVIIPLSLRKSLSLETNQKMLMHHVDNLLILKKASLAVDGQVVRSIDELGRIVLPKTFNLNWKEEDSIHFYQIEDAIVLTKKIA